MTLGNAVPCPDDFEPFLDGGDLFADADIMRECKRAAERQLRTVVLPSLHQKQYRGVGERAVPEHSDAPPGARLLPTSVTSLRNVRLFTRRCVKYKYWREQRGWMRDSSLSTVNAALAAVQPYTSHPELRKDAYGAKAKDISDQYVKNVPPEFVPNRVRLPEGGCTGRLQQWKQSRLLASESVETPTRSTMQSENAASAPVTPPVLKKVRWSAASHEKPLVDAVLAAPFNRKLPKKQAEWVCLAEKMPSPACGEVWDVATLKRHAKQLAKVRPDLAGRWAL